MSSKSRRSTAGLAALAATLVFALALAGTVFAAGDPPAADGVEKSGPTRVDQVEKATVRWHLAPASRPAAEATAALAERFRQLTEARFTGETDKLSPAPEVEVRELADGTFYGRLPAEHVHTMFLTIGEGGQRIEQCADAGALDKTPAKPALTAEGE